MNLQPVPLHQLAQALQGNGTSKKKDNHDIINVFPNTLFCHPPEVMCSQVPTKVREKPENQRIICEHENGFSNLKIGLYDCCFFAKGTFVLDFCKGFRDLPSQGIICPFRKK